MTKPLLNEALRLVRIYWGKTQSEMSSQIGVSQSYISEIEKGRREVTLDLVRKYSEELKVPMSTLMFFAESIDGKSFTTKGRLLMAGKALDLLNRLIPDEIDKAS